MTSGLCMLVVIRYLSKHVMWIIFIHKCQNQFEHHTDHNANTYEIYLSTGYIGRSKGGRQESTLSSILPPPLPTPIQFLSFSCSFRQKPCQIIGFGSKIRGWCPPWMGNPGSATGISNGFQFIDSNEVMISNCDIPFAFLYKDLNRNTF